MTVVKSSTMYYEFPHLHVHIIKKFANENHVSRRLKSSLSNNSLCPINYWPLIIPYFEYFALAEMKIYEVSYQEFESRLFSTHSDNISLNYENIFISSHCVPQSYHNGPDM